MIEIRNIKNETGNFVCECGKTFEKSQSFYGHQSHCKEHLGYERYAKAKERDDNAVKLAQEKKSELNKLKRESELKQWIEEKHICEHCGKVMIEKFGSGRFCSRACANSREKSSETRLKVSETLKNRNLSSPDNPTKTFRKNYSEETKELYSKGLIPRKFLKYYEIGKVNDIDYVVCPYCGIRMSEIQAKHLQLHNKTKSDLLAEFGQEYKLVSFNTYNKHSVASKKSMTKLISENKHIGWQSRNIRSYPELFWEKVLVNNGISFDFEHVLKKRKIGINSPSNYFLDFFIDGFIDLEIDGKQHQYEDRKTSDQKRDKLLKKHGFVVYRIPWINPKGNSEKVKEQIDKFLTWYNKIKEEEGIIVYSA